MFKLLNQGITQLPSGLSNCELIICGSERRWWRTTNPVINEERIIEIPQVTSLSLYSFVPLIQKYHFSRASTVVLDISIEDVNFSSFGYTVSNVTSLQILIPSNPAEYLSGIVSSLPKFLNLKTLNIKFILEFSDERFSASVKRMVETSKHIAIPLKPKSLFPKLI